MKGALTRFWSKVDRSGGPDACWIWLGCINRCGYGRFGFGPNRGDSVLAHRFSFEHFVGPLNGLECLHKCDNPACVNPNHLYAGTQLDNMRDRFGWSQTKREFMPRSSKNCK